MKKVENINHAKKGDYFHMFHKYSGKHSVVKCYEYVGKEKYLYLSSHIYNCAQYRLGRDLLDKYDFFSIDIPEYNNEPELGSLWVLKGSKDHMDVYKVITIANDMDDMGTQKLILVKRVYNDYDYYIGLDNWPGNLVPLPKNNV